MSLTLYKYQQHTPCTPEARAQGLAPLLARSAKWGIKELPGICLEAPLGDSCVAQKIQWQVNLNRDIIAPPERSIPYQKDEWGHIPLDSLSEVQAKAYQAWKKIRYQRFSTRREALEALEGAVHSLRSD